jgi:hypothetical protein
MGGESKQEHLMTNFGWSLVEATAQLLDGEEREAVLGDLVEAGENAFQALLDITGLIFRLQAELWRSWRPWLAAFGVSLPASLFLMGSSLSVSQSFERFRMEDPRRGRNGSRVSTLVANVSGSSVDRLVVDCWIRSGIAIAADCLDERRSMLFPLLFLPGKVSCALSFEIMPASLSGPSDLGSGPGFARDSTQTEFSHRHRFRHNVVDDPYLDQRRSKLVESPSVAS